MKEFWRVCLAKVEGHDVTCRTKKIIARGDLNSFVELELVLTLMGGGNLAAQDFP